MVTSMPVGFPPRLASLDEAVAYAHLSRRTLRRYIKDGRLTGYRLGAKHVRVDLDEVDTKLLVPIKDAS